MTVETYRKGELPKLIEGLKAMGFKFSEVVPFNGTKKKPVAVWERVEGLSCTIVSIDVVRRQIAWVKV